MFAIIIIVLPDVWRSAACTGEVSGLLRKEVEMSVSEAFQFIIMLCAVAMLFYTIGKDIHKQKKSDSDTKK